MPSLPSLEQLISLKGKRALITGAASGLGKAMAYRFAQAGADLELADINPETLAQTKTELAALGTKLNTHVLDVSKREQIDQLWEKLQPHSPDILVNNAGIYPFRAFVDSDEAFYRQVMDVNLFSTTWMCHHMIRQRGKRGGVILNLGSVEGVLPFKEDMAVYVTSKAAVMALTRALAKEHAAKGFRINALVPGGIVTPGTRAFSKQVVRHPGLLLTGLQYYSRLPARRAGQPDEVARMALVMVSDLSSYMHGTTIPIDGGFLSA
jgi:NAD(P)-dependent dehydrogenase (short-subunit alcohol dehydrogenase family)